MTHRRVLPVFSLWAWLVMTPHFIVQVNGVDAATSSSDLPAGIAVAIEVDLLLGAAFLGFGAIERLLARWPAARWSFVAVGLLACAYARPLLLTVLQGLFGTELTTIPMLHRFLVNLVVITVVTLVLHLLLETLARNLAARDRMLLVEADLETQATLAEAYRDEVRDRFRDEHVKPVLDALGRLFARDLPPKSLADELDWIALVIVPATGDRAGRASLGQALEDLIPTPEAAPDLATVRRLLSPTRVRAAPAWVVGLVFLVLLPAGVALAPLPTVLLIGSGAIALALLLGAIVRLVPLPASPTRAIIALSGLYLLTAVAPSFLIVVPATENPLFLAYGIYGTIGHALVTVLAAVAMSGYREVRAHRTAIGAAISAAQRRLDRARASLAELGDGIAHVLQGRVRADLETTSARLRSGALDEAPLETLFTRVEAALVLVTDGRGDEGENDRK